MKGHKSNNDAGCVYECGRLQIGAPVFKKNFKSIHLLILFERQIERMKLC